MKSAKKTGARTAPTDTTIDPSAGLTPRLIKRTQGEFVASSLEDASPSEVIPVGRNILVLMDVAAETTSGGIMVTASQVERDTMASESGVVVEVADGAFRTNTDGTPYVGRKPVPGDRVYVERYSGSMLMVDTGEVYRLMPDTCVQGIYIPPGFTETSPATVTRKGKA